MMLLDSREQHGQGQPRTEKAEGLAEGDVLQLKESTQVAVVCWFFNVPATCDCISGTDVLRQFYVLPH